MKSLSPLPDRVGRLAIVGEPIGAGRNRMVPCRCDCGTEKFVPRRSLLEGTTQSCGCLRLERARAANTRHGAHKNPIYAVWEQMRQRCSNQRHAEWKNYGGRGISVCPQWQTFDGFFADMGPRPDGGSLDRINNDGNYEPGNCRWATKSEQARNMRTTRFLEISGQRRPLIEWAEIAGIPVEAIKKRLRRGWPPDLAISAPANRRAQLVRGGVPRSAGFGP